MSAPLRATLTRLIGAHVCLHACMTGFRMATPLMALREGHSAAVVGGLLALFALAQVLLALPAGRYADRHGLRRPMRVAVAVAVLGGAVAVVWPVLGALCFTAFACGASSCITLIALQRHAGQLAHNASELRQVFSWMAIGPSFSNFLGPLLAGVLIDAAGFRAAYAVLTCLPLLSAWWLRGAAELQVAAAPSNESGDGHAASQAPLKTGSAWELLNQPAFRRLMLVNWMLSSCWDVHTFLVPVLGHERALPASVIGGILGGFALAATLIRFAMPWLAVRLQEGTVVAVAMVTTAALFALYPWADAAWSMGTLSALLGVALGSVQPMIMSTLHQITPKHRHGQALGLRAMAISGSSVVMPTLFGSVGMWLGAAGMFWLVGAVVGLGSRLAWGMRKL